MKLKSPFVILLVFILAILVFGFIHDRRIGEGFAAIQPDATEDSIRSLLGKPSSVDPSCAAYGTQLTQNCDHVLVYKSAFSPFRSSYWPIFVDTNGHTKATSRQSNP
jgi:hypothetical protein